jgi:hypothetical protein
LFWWKFSDGTGYSFNGIHEFPLLPFAELTLKVYQSQAPFNNPYRQLHTYIVPTSVEALFLLLGNGQMAYAIFTRHKIETISCNPKINLLAQPRDARDIHKRSQKK